MKRSILITGLLTILFFIYGVIFGTASVTRFLTLRELGLGDKIEMDQTIVVLAIHSLVAAALSGIFLGWTFYLKKEVCIDKS